MAFQRNFGLKQLMTSTGVNQQGEIKNILVLAFKIPLEGAAIQKFSSLMLLQ
jgi:hypothetical protein